MLYIRSLELVLANYGFPGGSIPGSGRSHGEGNGNPLRYSCLGKSHGRRSLVGYSPQGRRVRHDRATSLSLSFVASLVDQLVKNLPEMWETWVQSLGWEDSLEKGTAAHSSILAWIIPWTEEFLMNLALMAMLSQTFSIYLAIQTVLKRISSHPI